ncbi:Vesicular integral-membrane protein VIP36 [Exaiptasia diaphana]|nr:Vesicular integral-membrane protein VIP36 [Exaiptasia diaphana]
MVFLIIPFSLVINWSLSLSKDAFFAFCLYAVGGGMTIPDWEFHGDTFISGDYIRLTPDHQSKQGSIWNTIAQFRGREEDTFALVRYVGSQERLTMLVDVDGKGEWTECFDVGGIKLPTGLYFGVSAATGELADNHDIISMKLYEVDEPKDSLDKKKDGVQDFSKIEPFADGAEKYRAINQSIVGEEKDLKQEEECKIW